MRGSTTFAKRPREKISSIAPSLAHYLTSMVLVNYRFTFSCHFCMAHGNGGHMTTVKVLILQKTDEFVLNGRVNVQL